MIEWVHLPRPPVPDHGHTDAQILWSAVRTTVGLLERLERDGAINPAWTREHILRRQHISDQIRCARMLLYDLDRNRITDREEYAVWKKWRAAWDEWAPANPAENERNRIILADERAKDLARIADELSIPIDEARALVQAEEDRLRARLDGKEPTPP